MIENSIHLPKNLFYLKRLFLVLMLKALIIIGIILYAGIELGPDEAQYWTWSRFLDWGYYSKPPGIAWQIWLGTQLFGHHELGVRFLSICLSLCQSIGIYVLAIQCSLNSRTAFWCAMLMAFTPLGFLGSFLAITDGGFIFFWILACVIMATALKQGKEANPWLIGLALLGGALFKWPIYCFWVFFFLCRWRYFSHQSLLQSIGGVGLSLIGLMPSLWWNWSHEWATFRHVLATLQGGHSHASQGGNFLEFIGSQFVLVSPILFLLFCLALKNWTQRDQKFGPPLSFCGLVSIGSLVVMMVLAIFQKIQGNWAVFAYPTGFILLGAYACEWQAKQIKWLKLGVVVSAFLMILFMTHSFYLFTSYKMNPFKHNLGWTQLGKELKALGYQPNQHFLVSDKYQTTSVLSFYSEGQKRAYFLNLNDVRKNQFSYWPSLQDEQKDQTGYFVWVENAPYLQKDSQSKQVFYQQQLKQYFEQVEYLGLRPLLHQGPEVVKGALIFKCQSCRQRILPDTNSCKF